MRTLVWVGLAVGCLAAASSAQTDTPPLESSLKAAKKQNKLVLVSVHQHL